MTNVCDEWKSRNHLHYHSGLSSSQGLMKDQVEQLSKIGVAATAIDIDKEPESVRSDVYTFALLLSVY